VRRAVVAGEALVDLIAQPDGRWVGVGGGGPFTAARALARLGVPVSFLGGLSSDRFGAALRAALVEDGVDLTLAPLQPSPTTLAVAELDETGSATYHFYLQGTSAAAVDPTAIARVAADPPDALHVGTLGLVMDEVGDALAGLVAVMPDAVLVFVDPNCRPAAVGDERRYRDRLGRVLARADVVKVSADDLAYLVPDALDPVAAARRLASRPGAVALVTDGDRPTCVVHATGVLVVPPWPVRVVDTVGAGDTFGGAFLASWLTAGRGPRELADLAGLASAVERAAVAAALACGRAGAQPPTLAELDRVAPTR